MSGMVAWKVDRAVAAPRLPGDDRPCEGRRRPDPALRRPDLAGLLDGQRRAEHRTGLGLGEAIGQEPEGDRQQAGADPVANAFTGQLPRRAFLVTTDLVRAAVALILPFVDQNGCLEGRGEGGRAGLEHEDEDVDLPDLVDEGQDQGGWPTTWRTCSARRSPPSF
jgi:hypothetical protein